jgi:hypothetical protein
MIAVPSRIHVLFVMLEETVIIPPALLLHANEVMR